MSSSELKLYFITYYRPLYFEVFSIYLSVFHEFMWSLKKNKKNFFWIFWIFFSLFSRGGEAIIRTIRVLKFYCCIWLKRLKSNKYLKNRPILLSIYTWYWFFRFNLYNWRSYWVIGWWNCFTRRWRNFYAFRFYITINTFFWLTL